MRVVCGPSWSRREGIEARPGTYGEDERVKERTDQEDFWAGGFGDEYTDRNVGAQLIASKTVLFARILTRTEGVGSVLELGANVGLNLTAIRQLLPDAELAAVEINAKAAEALRRVDGVEVHRASLLDFAPTREFDLVFTCGVLIHIAPDRLNEVYDLMVAASRRYILLAEYYDPQPVSLTYRGHEDRLFKRDFAGEMMERYHLRLIDYGFIYHGDPLFPQDDLTWFLLRTE